MLAPVKITGKVSDFSLTRKMLDMVILTKIRSD
jgi:hypothetical protein